MGYRTTAADDAIRGGARPVFLLTLSMPDGSRLRLANRAVTVRTTANQDGPYQYQPLLTGIDEFGEELDVFGLEGIGALTQAAVSIATTVDLAAQQGDWFNVAAATAELALWWDGMKWNDRQVILEGGVVQGIEFGQVGEETTFTLETSPPVSSESIGDDDRDLGDEWPPGILDSTGAEMSDLTGRKHIYVFGTPESVPAYKVGAVAGDDTLVLCGHRLPNLSPVTVYEDGASGAAYAPVNVSNSTGDYASVSSALAGVFEAMAGAYTWKAANGGIARADDASRPCTNAGHVLRRLLRDSGLRIDYRRCARTFARLAEWRIGFYTDSEVPAIDLIRDKLAAYLPIVEMQGGEGLYFAYVDPHNQPIDGDLVLGQNLVGRIGGMTISDLDAIRNSFTINYAREEFSDTYTAALTVDDTSSVLCMLSRQMLRREALGDTGIRADDPLDCPITWDAATARRILLARASRLALPRRMLTYYVAADAYWLDVGGVYRLTDPEMGISQQRGVITGINRSLAPYEMTIEMLDRSPTGRS
jgi:hypothetical protein